MKRLLGAAVIVMSVAAGWRFLCQQARAAPNTQPQARDPSPRPQRRPCPLPAPVSAETKAARAKLDGFKADLDQKEAAIQGRTMPDADLQNIRLQIEPILDEHPHRHRRAGAEARGQQAAPDPARTEAGQGPARGERRRCQGPRRARGGSRGTRRDPAARTCPARPGRAAEHPDRRPAPGGLHPRPVRAERRHPQPQSLDGRGVTPFRASCGL